MTGAVYLLRHGVTCLNEEGRLLGSRDVPLSPEGHAQARRAAEILVGMPIARIWSSPLSRAHETARYVGERLGLEVTCRDALQERDWGVFEGRPRSERPAMCPEPDGGEPEADFEARVGSIFAEAVAAAPVLLVTHSGVMRVTYRIAGCSPGPSLGHGVPVALRPEWDGWRADIIRETPMGRQAGR